MRGDWVSVWVMGVAILGLLAGCASRGSVRRLESELATVSNKIEELRKLHEATARDLARTVTALKELQSSATGRLQEEQATTQQLSRMEASLDGAAATIRSLRASFAELSREVARLTASPRARELPREPNPRPGSAEQLYEAALASMRAGEHGQAVLDFLDFIAKFPTHPLAGHAQYWIGEAYYLQRDFRQALIEFRKVIDQPEMGAKAADALLKIGLCYRELNDQLRAREAWDALIAEFPGSEAARKARTLIRARPASATHSR